MRKIILALAAGVLGLTLTGSAQAHDGGYHRPVVRSTYYRDHGRRFDHGYYYSGRDHQHWAHRVWDNNLHRYHYYDAGLHCYFYWNEARSCYYPIDYCP